MGVSTDALIWWGLDLGIETDERWPAWLAQVHHGDPGVEEGWEDVYAQRSGGIENPWIEFTGDRTSPESHEFYQAHKSRLHDYWARRREIVDGCKVTIDTHGHSRSRHYLVAVTATLVRASRGYPQTLDPRAMLRAVDQKALMDFCMLMDIESGEPGWMLASTWEE